ncbi:MAG: di-heme oxidoredictase family protein [Candidatus Sulfotelmatobacter sp.]
MRKMRKYGPLVLSPAITFFTITLLIAQKPVFQPAIDIEQQKLLKGCLIATDPACFYPLKDVLNSGGDFWTTPFQPYDPVAKTGDGYGEGANGPRAAQRAYFNPQNPTYRFLRLNGLDSQSCFECHNSTGSDTVDSRGALIRKPYGVAGSAGSNSNAFINPLYPYPETLFIRNPPAVFGSGYQQALAEEMTLELFLLRVRARQMAKLSPGKQYDQPLTAKGVKFGDFLTTYQANSPAKVIASTNTCDAGVTNSLSIGGANGYTDDLTKLDGVSCDLVVRPFQWKGVASGLRHFVRDAMDFHFSMQAFEKVALCDCDRDEKGTPATGPEVTIGQVSATVSFVAMTRPPVQVPLSTPSEKLGQEIFFGKGRPGLYENMCANCHLGPLKLLTPNVLVEWPTNPADETAAGIDPDNPDTWPIKPAQCPNGIAPMPPNACPMESSYSGGTHPVAASAQNRGALVSPLVSSQQLSIVRRFNAKIAALQTTPGFQVESLASQDQLAASIKKLRSPLTAEVARTPPSSPAVTPQTSVVGQDYVIPLSLPNSDVTDFQLPRLPANADGTVDVPLFSDLKRHNMGTLLSDPPPPQISQGTDVANINTEAPQYLTRPLWGVADTGPWLHDGRALTLTEAILMHGDTASKSGSDAAPVIDAFEKSKPSEQQAVVDFLLTLRLPPPKGVSWSMAAAK